MAPETLERSIEKRSTLDKKHYSSFFPVFSAPVFFARVIPCCTLLDFSLNYRDAFLTMRRHRINLNLIHDHNSKVSIIVENVQN